MTDTEISTPVETADVTTSANEVSQETTSDAEVTGNETTAETETEEQTTPETVEKPQEERLYAGKYKSIEELEKGYAEAQKTLTQNLQMKSKYEELLKQKEQQDALRYERAKEQGFNTPDDMQIANYIKQAELNEFIDVLPYYVPEDAQIQVQQYLNAYQKTGDARYLNEAKEYYPAEFLEKVAVGKKDVESRMRAKLEHEAEVRKDKATAELAEIIKADYADFISDFATNKGKAEAFKMFDNGGFIQSKEDMDVFVNIYNQIADVVKANAIKEYEAQKVIDETKQKATIPTDGQVGIKTENQLPTAQEMRDNPKLYADAVKKWGMERVDKEFMKG
jgi:hypothetical protein